VSTKDHKPIPAEIKEWLEIDFDIPEGLRWKKDKGIKKKGDPAGCISKRGDAVYYVVKFRQQLYLTHRVIYFLQTGIDPGDKVIDHVREDKSNKEIRLATVQENLRYAAKRSDSKNRYKGVYFHKRDKLWAARITVDNKTKTIGYFKTEIDAALAYDREARKHFKSFALTNFVDEQENRGILQEPGQSG
jgi:hypothetical protein